MIGMTLGAPSKKIQEKGTHWQVFELRQNSSLGKLQVRTSDHAFLPLLKLECYLVCYSTALYKTNIWGHLNRQQDVLIKALGQAANNMTLV